MVNGRYMNLGNSKRAKDFHKKISGLSYEDLLFGRTGKKEREVASVKASSSKQITSSTGLSNFEKVSRMMQSKRSLLLGP